MEATGARLIQYGKKNAMFKLLPFADIHWGNRGCAKALVKKHAQEVKDDPYSLWWMVGDYCDWISPGDPRFDPEAIDGEEIAIQDFPRFAAKLIDGLMSIYRPIKDKCLAVGYGNHELKYFQINQQMTVHDNVCKELEAPSIRYSGWFDLYFEYKPGLTKPLIIKNPTPSQIQRPGQRRLRVFSYHGASSAATPGSKLTALARMVSHLNTDLAVMAHIHEQLSKPFIRLGVDKYCKEIKQAPTIALVTGSYLRTYCEGFTSYSEIKFYPPTVLGVTKALYWPENGRLVAENGADGVGELIK